MLAETFAQVAAVIAFIAVAHAVVSTLIARKLSRDEQTSAAPANNVHAVNFDRSGTTRIGKYVLNHSFMIPGLVSTVVSVGTGLIIAKVFF